MNRIPASASAFAFAFASTVAAVSIGATAAGDAYAQPLLAQHSGSAYFGPFGEPPYAQPLLAQHSGSAHYGPFGEPPLVIKDTAVMGSAAMPTVESVESKPGVKTTFSEPPLVIKDTAVMGGAATPTVEPFEVNFPEPKPAQ